MKWTRIATTTALALATMSAPLASARDRCDSRYTSSYSRYDGRANNSSYAYGYRDNGYRDNGYRTNDYGRYRDYRNYRDRRSTGESAAIIGGSAAAGAVVGALAGGGKGAVLGGVIGGIGGVVVDQATKNNHHYGRRR